VHLIPGQKVVTPEVAEAINLAPLDEDQRELFAKEHDLDYSYSISEEDRYRTNVLRQRLGVAGSYRLIDKDVRSLPDLGFKRPEVIERLTTHHQGLILVTGPAGCGKSSTLASLVDYINRNRHDHIITVEDPIEVIHRPINCNITQRELNTHTRSFGNALRAALREDPDIIVIGELRDLETIEMAIRSSETGHLVIGTLHTGSAATTMDRILDVFPPNQQAQIRAMVSESLKGVICQQLLPNRDNTGVVLAAEIMLGTLAVSNLIREGKTFQLPSTIQTGRNIGMSTMEQSYVDLYMAGLRTFDQTIHLVESQELIRQMQQNEARMAAEAAGLNTTKKRGWGFGRK
jgi:twitching motility protein PilT